MEKEQQELMFKLSMYEQHIQQLQQQIQAVEQGLVDMMTLTNGLEELKGSKGKEILAPMGRGIFVKAKILDEKLTVDVGGKNLVKKDIESTKRLIEEQIKKLKKVKEELNFSLHKVGEDFTEMIRTVQEKEKSN